MIINICLTAPNGEYQAYIEAGDYTLMIGCDDNEQFHNAVVTVKFENMGLLTFKGVATIPITVTQPQTVTAIVKNGNGDESINVILGKVQ